MQTKHKYVLSSVAAGCVLLSLYALTSHTFESDSSPPSTRDASHSTEPDTYERLKIYSGSDTSWGASPFASGTPLTEAEPEKVFKKPNTEWKARNITLRDGRVVTYRFGEGNPPEVALSPEEIKQLPEKMLKGGLQYYMTPEAELGMKKFLESPGLELLVNKCANYIGWYPDPMPSGFVPFPHDLDIDRILIIDPETGRKRFDPKIVAGIQDAFNRLETFENPYVWKKCLREDEKKLMDQLREVWISASDSIPLPERDPNYVEPVYPALPPGVFPPE